MLVLKILMGIPVFLWRDYAITTLNVLIFSEQLFKNVNYFLINVPQMERNAWLWLDVKTI